MQDFVARNYRLLAVLALAVVLALIGSLTSLGTSSLPSRDEMAVRQTCQDAVTAQQTLPVPPSSYKGGVMPDALVQQMESKVAPTLNNYYMGSALASVTTLVQQTIQSEKSGKKRYLGGGVDSMNFSRVAVKNDAATVTAQAVLWTKLSQANGNKMVESIQHKSMAFSFGLVKVNGRWLINTESSNLLTGGA